MLEEATGYQAEREAASLWLASRSCLDGAESLAGGLVDLLPG